MSKQRLGELDKLIDEILIFTNIDVDSETSCATAAKSTRLKVNEVNYIYYSLRNKSEMNFEFYLTNHRTRIINGEDP